MTETRTETDSIGPIEVPAQAYWGAQTQRSRQNFPFPAHERMPLGIVPEQEFGQQTHQLCGGDTWLMFTDGVTEAMNEDSEIYGTGRLKDSLARAPKELEPLIQAIVDDVENHCGDRDQSDDMCLTGFRCVDLQR